MDWGDVVATIVSLISLGFNVWLSIRNWNRRASVHWCAMGLLGRDRSVIAAGTDGDGRPRGLSLEPNADHDAYTVFRLMNNGNLQAVDVRLYAYGCELEAVQRLGADGADEVRGFVFPCVDPFGCIFVRVWKPGVKVGYRMRDMSARFCVYWVESGRKPDYMRQDFAWVVSEGGKAVNEIRPLGHPKSVSEDEHSNGAPIVDEYAIRGFVSRCPRTGRAARRRTGRR